MRSTYSSSFVRSIFYWTVGKLWRQFEFSTKITLRPRMQSSRVSQVRYSFDIPFMPKSIRSQSHCDKIQKPINARIRCPWRPFAVSFPGETSSTVTVYRNFILLWSLTPGYLASCWTPAVDNDTHPHVTRMDNNDTYPCSFFTYVSLWRHYLSKIFTIFCRNNYRGECQRNSRWIWFLMTTLWQPPFDEFEES